MKTFGLIAVWNALMWFFIHAAPVLGALASIATIAYYGGRAYRDWRDDRKKPDPKDNWGAHD